MPSSPYSPSFRLLYSESILGKLSKASISSPEIAPELSDLSGQALWLKKCEKLDSRLGDFFWSDPELRDPSIMNMILIDLSRMCIVHASGNERFIALSYVWGGTKLSIE